MVVEWTVVINENLIERAMACKIIDGKPVSVALAPLRQTCANPIGQVWPQGGTHRGETPHEPGATPDSEYEFGGQRTPVNGNRGTDQRSFVYSIHAEFFNHPHVGVAHMDSNGKQVKAAALQREYLAVDSGSEALLTEFCYSCQRNNARQMFRCKALEAARAAALAAAEAARLAAVADSPVAGPAHGPEPSAASSLAGPASIARSGEAHPQQQQQQLA
jgi:hypothetical protein